MKLLLPLLLLSSSLFGQNPCEDFLSLIGQRDNNQRVIDFRKNCGPFEESITSDKTSKTWTSLENGVKIFFINRAKDEFVLPKYEVIRIELSIHTSHGGYKSDWPFAFKTEMDYRAVKKHIKTLENVKYERSDFGIDQSSFIYTGPLNQAAKGRKLKVYVSQNRGRTISTIRYRLY